MAIGDINIKTLKIGDMDVSGKDGVFVAGFNIYEDILNPYGPVAEVRVIDPKDSLGEKKINGSFDKDVEIEFSPDDKISGISGSCKLKLKMLKNANLNDQSIHNTGSGKHKQYDMRCVSPELLNAQGNQIEKSFNGKTSEVIKHVLEKGFKTKKQMEISETKGKRRIVIPRSHPLDVVKMMNTEHVSDKYKSSTFALFQQGNDQGEHKYVFKTFEELFEQQEVVTLKQSTTLNFSGDNQQERQNSIMWFKPSASFTTEPRALSKTSEHAVDLTTHKVIAADKKEQNKFKFADKEPVYEDAPSYIEQKPIKMPYIHDKANNKDKHGTSKARVDRADFLSHLAQNSAELECYYNPKIKLGCMIKLDIPRKSDKENEKGEAHWNGKCMVVAIRTKYRVANEPPHCTMVLRVAKASFKKNSDKKG